MICEICGATAVHKHHVFGGPLRKWSERYELTMDLCLDCHHRMHADYEFAKQYKQKYQKIFIDEHGWEIWWKEFGRSWI
jgi:hypothetical protein